MTDVVHGYYGKLPVSPEFLRLHASGPEIRWLDEWLQQGILYAKAQEGAAWAERIAQASPCGFFYVPRHEGRVVCGVMIASQDKAGRSFPFLRYALTEREGWAAAPWLIPVEMAQFVHDTTLAIRRLREKMDWDVFRRSVEDTASQEPSHSRAQEVFDSFKNSTTIGQWCFGEARSVGEARQLAAEQLVTRMVQARRQGRPDIRFPIDSEGSGSNGDLAFWLQLCLQPRSNRADSGAGSLCFWKRDTAYRRGTALVSIGPGSPNVVRFLANPEAQDDSWWDMAAAIPDAVLAKRDDSTQSPRLDLDASLAMVAQGLCEQIKEHGVAGDGARSESARPNLSSLVVL